MTETVSLRENFDGRIKFTYLCTEVYDNQDEGTQQSPLSFGAGMELTEKIKALAEQHLKDPAHFVVEVIALFRKNPKKLLVIVDGDQGITIDDCAHLSRALSDALDNTGLMADPYMLEVSTPGLDHPLKLLRQYRKNTGRKIKVKLKDKTVEGKLAEVSENEIALIQETGKGKKKEVTTLHVPFSEIEKTFVMISFN